MDNKGVSKADLYSICKDLAKQFDFAKKLNSAARQASANVLGLLSLTSSPDAKKVQVVGSIDPTRKVFQSLKNIVALLNTRFQAGSCQMIVSQSH
jgi:hypothetical protein